MSTMIVGSPVGHRVRVEVKSVSVDGLMWLGYMFMLGIIILAFGLAHVVDAINVHACVTAGETLARCQAAVEGDQ